MFAKTIIFTSVVGSFLTGAFAAPAYTTGIASYNSTTTAPSTTTTNAAEVAERDDTEYCTSQGVAYPCSYSTGFIPTLTPEASPTPVTDPLSSLLSSSLDTLEARSKTPHYVTYCSKPGDCSRLEVTGVCQTFGGTGFPLLTFGPGLSCDVYKNGECTKQAFVKAGKVSDVEGYFDVYTDARAAAHKVGSVGSFWC